MTREEARNAAEVMLAYANGEEIETIGHNEYVTPSGEPSFNWDLWKYRTRPKPKFDPKTLQPFDKVLARDTEENLWKCRFFSYIMENEKTFKYDTTAGIRYKCCIPYNDDTKHLAGTSKEAPKFYRYWED